GRRNDPGTTGIRRRGGHVLVACPVGARGRCGHHVAVADTGWPRVVTSCGRDRCGTGTVVPRSGRLPPAAGRPVPGRRSTNLVGGIDRTRPFLGTTAAAAGTAAVHRARGQCRPGPTAACTRRRDQHSTGRSGDPGAHDVAGRG